MDVQCERCKTEYEFDDALVSGRGTTVKCTNCGYQFKIRPVSNGGDVEQWSVHTSSGQLVVFTSLRELQKAITNRQVGRGDSLSRGNAPPRQLGAIAELEPFFADAGAPGARPGAAAVWREGASPATAPPPPVAPKPTSRPPPPPVPKRSSSRPPAEEVRPRMNTLRPPSEMSAAVPPPPQHLQSHGAPAVHTPPPSPVARSPFARSEGPATASYPPPRAPSFHEPSRTPTPPPAPPFVQSGQTKPPPPPAPRAEVPSSMLPPPTVPVRHPAPSYDDLGDSGRPPLDEDDLAEVLPRNGRVGGWVIAVIVLAGVSGLGYYALRPYLGGRTAGVVTAAIDPRATQFVTDGERAIGEGNLDVAKENFDKASALAEKDPRVLLDLARLAAARADVPWLKMRLLPPDSADDIASTKQSLDELSGIARKAADASVAASPDDPASVRAKVDALRIAGERDAARTFVAKIIASAAQPETAYVLAALDLAELDPLWPTIIDRLRLAAGGEGNAGRARAALVYALARSGDATGAKAELDKLTTLARPHPLAGALRAFLARGPQAAGSKTVGPSVDGGAKVPSVVDVSSLPVARPAGGGGGVAPAGGGGGGGGAPLPGDPRVLLEQAENAKNKGDYDRAKMLYEAALAKSPGDSQALAGLGDAARAQHDSGTAKSFYQRALANNPNYLPALIGLADVEVEEGDHERAQKAYKDIVDRFPEGSYPGRVKQRAEGPAPAPAPTTAPAPTPSPTTAPAPAPTPQGDSPGSGTGKQLTVPANTPSDLPGTTPP